MKLLIMKFPPLPCLLVPLWPNYSLQHPVLKYTQPTFLPQCQRSSFTPIQNNRQNYSSGPLRSSPFSILSDDRFKASSKTVPPHSAI
jgi:hypothetical protein